MKEFNVGLIQSGKKETVIKQTEDGTFLNTKKELGDWVYCLNEPWSRTSMYYEILPNYQEEDGWCARKVVIVFDDLEAVIAAQGATPQEAVIACEEFIEELTNKYYQRETKITL